MVGQVAPPPLVQSTQPWQPKLDAPVSTTCMIVQPGGVLVFVRSKVVALNKSPSARLFKTLSDWQICCLAHVDLFLLRGVQQRDCSPVHVAPVCWSWPVSMCRDPDCQSAPQSSLIIDRQQGVLISLPCAERFALAGCWVAQLLWHSITASILETAPPPDTPGLRWTSDPSCLRDKSHCSIIP